MTDRIPEIRVGHKWTPSEDAFVQDKVGALSTAEIASNLNRSVRGVLKRYKVLNLNLSNAHGVTAAYFSRATDIPLQTVLGWLQKGQIPGEKVEGGFWRVYWDGSQDTVPAWNGKNLHPDLVSEEQRKNCANCGAPLHKAEIWCSRRCRVEHSHNLFFRKKYDQDEPGFEQPPYLRPKFRDFMSSLGLFDEDEQLGNKQTDSLKVLRRLWQKENMFVSEAYLYVGQILMQGVDKIVPMLEDKLQDTAYQIGQDRSLYKLHQR